MVRDIMLGTRRRRAMTLAGIGMILCALIVELGCQAVAWVQLGALERARLDPKHYYQRSDDATLVYELRHDCTMEIDGRTLHVNRAGFREETDEKFGNRRRVAILGDSVVFGTGLSQDQSIPATLQKMMDPGVGRAKFLNCGLPGLGLGEFPAWLRRVQSVYAPDAVVYVLNPNDFVIRDTLYEGADNGLYKQYRHPWLKTPWVVRKAIYRMKKGGISPSTSWYRWTFDGTKGRLWGRFKELADLCAAGHATFHVVLLPVRDSFSGSDRTMSEIYKEIGEKLTGMGIAWTDPSGEFAKHGGAKGLIDDTDHLTAEGCAVMAGAMRGVVEGK
jgi:hypothetical protein